MDCKRITLMRCGELLAMLNEYVDGTVDPGICEEFEKHLAGCSPCQVVIDNIRHNAGCFALTAAGIAMLQMRVLGVSGIYRGMIDDALVVVVTHDHRALDVFDPTFEMEDGRLSGATAPAGS